MPKRMTYRQFRAKFFASHRLHAMCCIHYERHAMRRRVSAYIDRLVDAAPLAWYERAESEWGKTEIFQALFA